MESLRAPSAAPPVCQLVAQHEVSYTPVKGWYCESSAGSTKPHRPRALPQQKRFNIVVERGGNSGALPETSAEFIVIFADARQSPAGCSRLGIGSTHPSPGQRLGAPNANPGKTARDPALAAKGGAKSEAEPCPPATRSRSAEKLDSKA